MALYGYVHTNTSYHHILSDDFLASIKSSKGDDRDKIHLCNSFCLGTFFTFHIVSILHSLDAFFSFTLDADPQNYPIIFFKYAQTLGDRDRILIL